MSCLKPLNSSKKFDVCVSNECSVPVWCNIFYRKALNIFCCLHLFPHISNITTQCRVQPCKVLQNGIQIWPPSCYISISPEDVLILYLHLHEPEAFTRHKPNLSSRHMLCVTQPRPVLFVSYTLINIQIDQYLTPSIVPCIRHNNSNVLTLTY